MSVSKPNAGSQRAIARQIFELKTYTFNIHNVVYAIPTARVVIINLDPATLFKEDIMGRTGGQEDRREKIARDT